VPLGCAVPVGRPRGGTSRGKPDLYTRSVRPILPIGAPLFLARRPSHE
jgi:hypothetical protein